MKILKIIGHPISVICMYLLLLVSGKSFGGFYFLYILIGLPHGVPDAIVSVLGLSIMLLGYKINRNRFNQFRPVLYIVGNVIMILGLVYFFRASKGYNDLTFHQTVPLFSFVLFGLCVLSNFFVSILLLNQRTSGNNHINVVV